MDTNRLKYFCRIAETGSLTKASEILGISHSGLSKAVSVLETETNLSLFTAQGRGLEITQEGRWFYKKAQEILKIENEILVGIKVERSSIRIGLSEVLAITCTGLIANELEEPLTVIEMDYGQLENNILEGDVDFGFTFSPSLKTGVEYLEIGEIKFNSFAREDLLKNKALEELPFAVPSSNLPFNPLGYKIRDGWPQDMPRLQQYSVSGFSVALSLLRSGKSAVYMPNFVATLENESATKKSHYLKLTGHENVESKRKVFLVKMHNSKETKGMKKVSKVLRKLCY